MDAWEVFLGVKPLDIKLNKEIHPVPRLGIGGAIRLLPLYASMVRTEANAPLPSYH